MGTSNFHSHHARNTYAVCMNYEEPILDEDDNETGETESRSCEYHEVLDFIECLKIDGKQFASEKKLEYHEDLEMKDPHELRSFCSTPLFQFYLRKSFGDIGFEVSVNCVIRAGYYEGGCLDWFPTVSQDGTIYEYDKDFEAEINEYNSSMRAGLCAIQQKNANKWIHSQIEVLIEAVEEFFTKNSTPLVVTARFSNGETMYSKITKDEST